MLAMERLLTEQHFHDRQAEERAAYFAGHRDELVFADRDYLDHETWIRPAFAQLGDLRGKDVLDYGCGHGMASVVLARRGARVSGFDLSSGYIAEARQRAEVNGVHVVLRQADAEELPFADGSFDSVWGCAILHHLDLERAGRELKRVLRPGGVAVFCEPWGENPLLRLSRSWLPYPGKERTPDEKPLRWRDLQPLRQMFRRVEIEGMQFLGMVRRLWRRAPRPAGWLDRVDSVLLRRFHFLKNWCRYVVIELHC